MAFGEPIRDRRSERHEATRAEILDAAWRVAQEQGLAALSLRDLAKAVGMQPPSLYSYFASKAAIYDAMFADGYRQFFAIPGARDTATTDEEFKAGARTWFGFCTADPARYQLLFQRTIPGFEPSAASMALAIECLEVGRASLAGIGVTEPEALDLFTALMTGLTDQQLSNDPGGDRWGRLVDDAVDMFLAHVRADRPPKKTTKKKGTPR